VVPGVISVIIKLTSGNTITTLCAVVANVYQSTTDSVVDPGAIIPSVETLIAEIEAAVASIPADYSSLWTKLAPAFSDSTAYKSGQYVTYNGGLYRFRVDHSGTWVSTDAVSVTLGGEMTKANNLAKPLSDAIYTIGDDKENTVQLVGEVVPYRYSGESTVNTQTSLKFTLPPNVATVDITLPTVNNINSYTFLDENNNIVFYKKETATNETPTTYTDLNAWEARYLVCGNNSTWAGDIVVTAKIKGVELYIDEAKKATGGEQLTLLHGTPKSTYYNLFTEYNGNYSVEYDVTGYDYADITSYNHTTANNKYTMFDANGNVIGFYQIESGSSDIGHDRTIRVAIPTNAAKLWVGTARSKRPSVAVYGVKMPDDFGWVNMGGVFVDYYYHQYLEEERANGSKEFPAQEFDILRLANGVTGQGINTFTAFDENGDVVGFMSLSAAEAQEKAITGSYFICPKGTVKVAIAAGNINQGLNRTNAIVAQKRKTGKKLSVMGDSISTNKNFIPDGNATYYEDGNRGVPTASYTWWGVVAREKGYKISTVQAWSGSKVSAPNGETNAMSGDRAGQLAAGGTPDIIIIYGGVNDFLQEAPLGTWDGHSDIPSTNEQFRKAYAMMLNKIHINYPLAMVYCCTIANCNRDGTPNNLENIGGQWLHDFNSAIRQIAPMFNCTVIEVESCGINQQNLETYMGDFSTSTGSGLHPNQYGHALFARRILEYLDRQ
jgi:lysophospholipase L1-like esterase